MATTVNGRRIDDETIHAEAEKMRPEFERAFADEDPVAREKRLMAWARENAVERVLLRIAAEADLRPLDEAKAAQTVEALRGEPGLPADEALLRKEVETRLKTERLLEEAADTAAAPTDADCLAYYEGHRDEFRSPEMIHASHIVKHPNRFKPPEVVEEELRAMRSRVEAGEDFAALADGESDCQDRGGDLGWFPRGHMVEEFEEVVFGLKPGEMSDVFATRFGFHVVKVLERRPAGSMPFDAVKETIRAQLAEDRRSAATDAYFDGLREKATIEEA